MDFSIKEVNAKKWTEITYVCSIVEKEEIKFDNHYK